ncbi:MAG: thioesterase [Gammaproteobacteria bacterium]|nr:thioesterase [Gammaproteobacteria bacterium]
MPANALMYRGTVYPWHCDHMGHMNVMWYVGKFDEASWQVFAAIGLTRGYLRVHNRSMAGVDQRISYRRELHAGDVVSVHSSVIEIRNSSLRFVHLMRDAVANHLIAATVLTAVHMDSTTRKSCAFADEIRAGAARLLVPDPQPWLSWPLPASLLE